MMKARHLRIRAVRLLRRGLGRLVELPRGSKRLMKAVYDLASVLLAFFSAHLVATPEAGLGDPALYFLAAILAPLSLSFLVAASLYRPIAFARDIDILRAGAAAGAAGGAAMAFASLTGLAPVSLGAAVIHTAFAAILIGGGRVGLRGFMSERRSRTRERILIYGAGEAGRQLLAALRERGRHNVVGFADDNPDRAGSRIGGLHVFAGDQVADAVRTVKADVIMLAMPSISATRRREILHRLEPLEQPVRTVPDINDLLSGKAPVSQVRAIAPEDLLGRDPVPPRRDLIDSVIAGRTVLVTGAGGSIGSELCRQIAQHAPARLVLVEQSEYALYAVMQELEAKAPHMAGRLDAHLGRVEDETRMGQLFEHYGVQAVFHTAAYKHVPLVEANTVDAVRNNAFGTLCLARAAVRAGVDRFVLVSTDKAVRPANVMGATKRLAELICQTLARSQTGTRIAVVRFGNVLDSSGSVAPLFRRQIERGGPVTVTHNEATRYFMTLSEAAQLVVQAGALTEHGDTFVLGMGEPVRITDLAERMVRLAGYRPRFAKDGKASSREILITFTGLRPGEKLTEELFVTQRADGTEHPLIMREGAEPLDMAMLNGLVARLEAACEARDEALIEEILLHPYVHFRPVLHGESPGRKRESGRVAL